LRGVLGGTIFAKMERRSSTIILPKESGKKNAEKKSKSHYNQKGEEGLKVPLCTEIERGRGPQKPLSQELSEVKR